MIKIINIFKLICQVTLLLLYSLIINIITLYNSYNNRLITLTNINTFYSLKSSTKSIDIIQSFLIINFNNINTIFSSYNTFNYNTNMVKIYKTYNYL